MKWLVGLGAELASSASRSGASSKPGRARASLRQRQLELGEGKGKRAWAVALPSEIPIDRRRTAGWLRFATGPVSVGPSAYLDSLPPNRSEFFSCLVIVDNYSAQMAKQHLAGTKQSAPFHGWLGVKGVNLSGRLKSAFPVLRPPFLIFKFERNQEMKTGKREREKDLTSPSTRLCMS